MPLPQPARLELQDTLRRVGLTDYEASAYLALLAAPEMTAEDISRASAVPITRVYDTLEDLARKGFAKEVSGRPRKFEAAPPSHATTQYLGYLRRSFEQRSETVRDSLDSLRRTVEPVYWHSHLQVKPEELIDPLADLDIMESNTLDAIRSAREEILISTALFSWFPKAERSLIQASKRGAHVRVLMQVRDGRGSRIIKRLNSSSLKIRDTPDPWHPVRGTLVDDSELVFVIWAAEESERYWYPKVYRPHRTKNPGLIRLFRESFEYRWANARTGKA